MDYSTTPAMPAPAGQVTNFHPGVTEIQQKFINVYAATLAAGTFTLALRLWTRARIIRELWWDDYMVIGAWLMNIGFFVCCLEWMKYGFGDHLWNVSLLQLQKYAEWATPVVTTYCWAPMLTKFSILLLYLRLNPGRWFKCSVFFLMFVILAYTLATTLIVAAGCKPTDPSKTQCINNLALAQAILNIASDFFVIVLPLPMIYKLQMPRGQKVALAILLSAGSFVVIASIIRLVIIQALPGETDTTWVEAETCVWSAIEINVGLICNCLVVLKPFVQRYAGSLLSFNSHSNQYNHSSHASGVAQKYRARQDSYPLSSMDGIGNDTETESQEGKRVRGTTEEIFVTDTYTVKEDEERGSTPMENRRAARVHEVFRSESQEEIAARVRAFRAYQE